jgi:rRNA small subunit pseudouridine methyltransferase Nep1
LLSLIFAESALELVPRKLANHISVTSHAKKIGKNPQEILLDNSWHFAAMKEIKNELKRGRPDIIHLCLQNACSTPLYINNRVNIYIHTIDDKVIFVGNDIYLPKSYHRFAGLIEKLFLKGIIQYKEKTLLKLEESMSFTRLVDVIKPSRVIGFSAQDKVQNTSFANLGNIIQEKFDENTCVVIGGFQKGEFTSDVKSVVDEFYKIGDISLEAHVITSRILYEYEKTIFMRQ